MSLSRRPIFKSRLIEWRQKNRETLAVRFGAQRGVSGQIASFRTTVLVDGRPSGDEGGRDSKKESEQRACQEAIRRLERLGESVLSGAAGGSGRRMTLLNGMMRIFHRLRTNRCAKNCSSRDRLRCRMPNCWSTSASGRRSGDSAVGLMAAIAGALRREAFARWNVAIAGPLRMVGGLGILEAARLPPALELGRRLWIEEGQQIDSVRTDQDIVAMFQQQLGALPYEAALGGLSQCFEPGDRPDAVQPGGRFCYRRGSPADRQAGRPSKNWRMRWCWCTIIRFGKRTAERRRQSPDRSGRSGGFALFDITLLDHIIVTAGPCYSFRSHGFFR